MSNKKTYKVLEHYVTTYGKAYGNTAVNSHRFVEAARRLREKGVNFLDEPVSKYDINSDEEILILHGYVVEEIPNV